MISIKNLNKSYGTRQILNNINLDIPQKSIFALLGPNGSGKTTLLKCILELVIADSGSIGVQEKNLSEYKKNKDNYIGYMPQIPLFPANLSVKEILDYLTILGNKNPIFKEQLVEELKLNQYYHTSFGKLSMGTKQKVNIVQCFMCDLDLMVIDEPTASLDPHISFYLKNLIISRKNLSRTILFTSHVMSEVEEISDWMAVLVEGEIKTIDSPKSFIQKNQSNNLEQAILKYWDKK